MAHARSDLAACRVEIVHLRADMGSPKLAVF